LLWVVSEEKRRDVGEAPFIYTGCLEASQGPTAVIDDV
jgi:hypothetical protein